MTPKWLVTEVTKATHDDLKELKDAVISKTPDTELVMLGSPRSLYWCEDTSVSKCRMLQVGGTPTLQFTLHQGSAEWNVDGEILSNQRGSRLSTAEILDNPFATITMSKQVYPYREKSRFVLDVHKDGCSELSGTSNWEYNSDFNRSLDGERGQHEGTFTWTKRKQASMQAEHTGARPT